MPDPYLRLAALPPRTFSSLHFLPGSRLSYTIAIANVSKYPAQLPFFCVMDMGFALEAHGGWELDKIVSDGRKLVRCSYRGVTSLLPSGQVEACSLIAQISQSNGVHVSFGAGAPVALENLKDMRLFAITGAANFPAQRGYMLLPSAALRDEHAAVAANAPQQHCIAV